MAPATLVDAALRRASEGRIRLSEAVGTVWRGQGFLEFRDAGQRTALAKPINWEIQSATIWRARIVCDIHLQDAARSIPVEVGWSKTSIGGIDLELPASALALAEPKLSSLRLSGTLRLRASTLDLSREGLQGNLAAEWRSAGSALAPISPIGSYELAVRGEGKNVGLTVNTIEGPLHLAGTGSWQTGKSPELAITVTVPPYLREQFTPLLRLITVQADEGTFNLQLR